ncbi:50S ribosomal protein L10 [Candidatus Saccharibacteria bacterium]|nr:50S ribosomal protein L10 [Candidatus Saccharibacteria bacterium]
MALTKIKKQSVIDDVKTLLQSSKMTVVAAYPGTTVKAMQELRKGAKEQGTTVKVIKNRLVIKAIEASETLKDADTSLLTGQLVYAFNDSDEVAPAKSLANFAKTNASLQFVGGFSAEGKFMTAEEVSALAKLPSKNEIIAGIISLLNSPLNNTMSGINGNLHGILTSLEAKASN